MGVQKYKKLPCQNLLGRVNSARIKLNATVEDFWCWSFCWSPSKGCNCIIKLKIDKGTFKSAPYLWFQLVTTYIVLFQNCSIPAFCCLLLNNSDGTFKSAPHLWFQLVTISVVLFQNFSISAFCCLLPNNWSNILKELAERKPELILCDFEVAQANATSAIFALVAPLPTAIFTSARIYLTK